MTHEHICPRCHHRWWCEPKHPNQPCAVVARAEGGVGVRLCDLCWGMQKPGHLVPPRNAGETEKRDPDA